MIDESYSKLDNITYFGEYLINCLEERELEPQSIEQFTGIPILDIILGTEKLSIQDALKLQSLHSINARTLLHKQTDFELQSEADEYIFAETGFQVNLDDMTVEVSVVSNDNLFHCGKLKHQTYEELTDDELFEISKAVGHIQSNEKLDTISPRKLASMIRKAFNNEKKELSKNLKR